MTNKPKPEPLGAEERVDVALAGCPRYTSAQSICRNCLIKMVREAEAALREEMNKSCDARWEEAWYQVSTVSPPKTSSDLHVAMMELSDCAFKEAVEKEREACIADARNDNLLVDDPDHPGEKMAPETWTQDAIVAKIRRRGEEGK